MTTTRKKYRVGELHPSQVLFTYGIGSIVDLPYISTIVMGLDDWENPYPEMVGEERLLQAVQAVLGPQVARLLADQHAPITHATRPPAGRAPEKKNATPAAAASVPFCRLA